MTPSGRAERFLTDGHWQYTWDAENRLVAIETLDIAFLVGAPRQRFEFKYDYLGRRVQKRALNWSSPGWSLVSERRFLYDGWNLLAEYNTASAFTLVAQHVWGIDLGGGLQDAGGVGGLLKTVNYEQGTTTTLLPAFDGNGNMYAMLDRGTGTIRATFEYGAFGETLRASGNMASKTMFRFSTKYTDQETQFVYYGFRYFNPEVGRFLGRDPIEEKGGQHLYAFVRNNPTNRRDYLGLVNICPDDQNCLPTMYVFASRYDEPNSAALGGPTGSAGGGGGDSGSAETSSTSSNGEEPTVLAPIDVNEKRLPKPGVVVQPSSPPAVGPKDVSLNFVQNTSDQKEKLKADCAEILKNIQLFQQQSNSLQNAINDVYAQQQSQSVEYTEKSALLDAMTMLSNLTDVSNAHLGIISSSVGVSDASRQGDNISGILGAASIASGSVTLGTHIMNSLKSSRISTYTSDALGLVGFAADVASIGYARIQSAQNTNRALAGETQAMDNMKALQQGLILNQMYQGKLWAAKNCDSVIH